MGMGGGIYIYLVLLYSSLYQRNTKIVSYHIRLYFHPSTHRVAREKKKKENQK